MPILHPASIAELWDDVKILSLSRPDPTMVLLPPGRFTPQHTPIVGGGSPLGLEVQEGLEGSHRGAKANEAKRQIIQVGPEGSAVDALVHAADHVFMFPKALLRTWGRIYSVCSSLRRLEGGAPEVFGPPQHRQIGTVRLLIKEARFGVSPAAGGVQPEQRRDTNSEGGRGVNRMELRSGLIPNSASCPCPSGTSSAPRPPERVVVEWAWVCRDTGVSFGR